MKVASSISPDFIEGFVERCSDLGFNLDQTEELFRKHCNNALFTRPDIYEGFREKIASHNGNKATLAKCLTPDMISLAEDVRLHYGEDPMSMQLRAELNIPEPSWDTVPDNIKQAASQLSRVMDEFDYLPLNQKILLSMIIGGGVGGLGRAAMPSAEDEAYGRGPINRGLRGAARGAGIGAGGALGAAGGSSFGRMGPPGSDQTMRNLLMPLGAGAGALGANKLMGGL